MIAGGWWIWSVLFPGAVTVSEHIVREFKGHALQTVRDGERAIRAARSGTERAASAQAIQVIDAEVAQTLRELDAHADVAREAIQMLEGLSLRAQDNRMRRIRRILEDAKRAVRTTAATSTAELNTQIPAPALP